MKKKILTYLSFTFIIAWAVLIVAKIFGINYADSRYAIIESIVMVIPFVTVLIAKKISDEKIEPATLYMYPKFSGNIMKYITAYFLPIFITLIGAAAYFLVFRGVYDSSYSIIRQSMLDIGETEEYVKQFVTGYTFSTLFLSQLTSLFFCYFEELGFRGYLLHKMVKYFGGKDKNHSALKASLVTSAIWSIWYIPMHVVGLHYGTGYSGAPFLGILIGLLVYFIIGMLVSYFALKTDSVIPGALIRSGIEGMAALAVLFTKGKTFILLGPGNFGLLGCMGILIFALIYTMRMDRQQRGNYLFYKKPEKGQWKERFAFLKRDKKADSNSNKLSK